MAANKQAWTKQVCRAQIIVLIKNHFLLIFALAFLFLAIIATRYGFIPSDSTVITQLKLFIPFLLVGSAISFIGWLRQDELFDPNIH